MAEYDVAIIGAGPGGYEGAIRAAQLGMRVALIEKDKVGGTCLNRGCVPAKALLHASSLYSEAKNNFAEIGIEAENTKIDIEQLYAHKDGIVDTLRSGVENLLQANGVTLIEGVGSIKGQGKVHVKTADGLQEISAKNILVATGSRPSTPPIKGADVAGVVTSDDLLTESRQYKSMIVIGAGVIGVEFASFYAGIGCEVTIIEMAPRALMTMGKEIGQTVSMMLKKQGVKLHTGATVQCIEKADKGLSCVFAVKGKEQKVQAEAVLIATGRTTVLDGIFAENNMPNTQGGFVEVDEYGRTSLPGVYAAGDIVPGTQLAHVASAEAIRAVEHMAGKINSRKPPVPSCVYTNPEIATVGLTEEQAAEKNIEVEINKFLMSGNARVLIDGAGRSYIKLLAEPKSGKLLGAEMVCPRASDMIATIALAIHNEMTVEALHDIIYPHPTFVEGVGEASAIFGDGAIHAVPKKK